MTKPLSPAACAILNAYRDKSWTPDEEDNGKYLKFSHKAGMAAALRAAAHHLQRRSPWPNDVEGIGIYWSTSELHDIADELEGQ